MIEYEIAKLKLEIERLKEIVDVIYERVFKEDLEQLEREIEELEQVEE